jgi:2-desacetyl-2-hydroxyethyl bacteriochlorophyllide A dehydrogenase
MQFREAVIEDERKVVMHTSELDHDEPRPGEVLIETSASFISAGTELASYAKLDPICYDPEGWCAHPWRPGYANVGRVIAAGDGVDYAEAGDRVFTLHKHCSHHFATGYEWDMVVPVPDDVDDALAAAARMGMVAIAGPLAADVFLNDWVAVYGLGTVGNLAAQLFQIAGARVIGIDPVASRRELAERTGIATTIGGAREEVAAALKDLTGGTGPRISVDAVGHAAVCDQAIESTADHGEVIVLGTPRVEVQMNAVDIVRPVHLRWVTVKGALEWQVPMEPTLHVRHSIRGNLRTILSLLDQGKLQIEPLISHRLPADEIGTAYEGLLTEKDTYTGVALLWE